MSRMANLVHIVVALGLLSLVLAGCVPGAGLPPLPTPMAGQPTAAPAIARVSTTGPAAAASPASTKTVTATATITSTATNTPQPALTPTRTLTPTVVQGVKDTNVLVNAQLVRVIDGNTIEVKIGAQNYQVRYIGVTVPAEAVAIALAGNKKLVTGVALRLEKDVTDTDAEGRLLRYVYSKTYMVNADMLRLGYGRAALVAPDVRYKDLFATMENEARGAKRGLWAAAAAATAVPTVKR